MDGSLTDKEIVLEALSLLFGLQFLPAINVYDIMQMSLLLSYRQIKFCQTCFIWSSKYDLQIKTFRIIFGLA